MPTVAYKQRNVGIAHDERAQCIRNLTASERDQIIAVMYDAGMWVPRSRHAINESADRISKLLENPNIREHAPRLALALDSLQTILEHVDIAHGITLEY